MPEDVGLDPEPPDQLGLLDRSEDCQKLVNDEDALRGGEESILNRRGVERSERSGLLGSVFGISSLELSRRLKKSGLSDPWSISVMSPEVSRSMEISLALPIASGPHEDPFQRKTFVAWRVRGLAIMYGKAEYRDFASKSTSSNAI